MTTKTTAAPCKPTPKQLELAATLALEGLTAQEIAISLSDLADADAKRQALPAPARWTSEQIQKIMIAGDKARAAGLNAEHLESLRKVGIEPYKYGGRLWWGTEEPPEKKSSRIGAR